MTDKQIIIDGVDVSECTRYCADNGKCTAFKSQYLCSERNNCYIKRILKKNKIINILKEKLLRKEQECERLRFPMQDTNYAILAKEEFEEYKKLKAENEGLKILHESDKSLLKSKEQECERLKETFDDLFKVQYKLADNNKKLRQCLTEIKEIAEKRNYLDYNECLDDILQKISECEGNNE